LNLWYTVCHEPAKGERLDTLLLSPHLDVAQRLASAWGRLLADGRLLIDGKLLQGGAIRVTPTRVADVPDSSLDSVVAATRAPQ
jgi:hypothetical protein